MTEKIRGGDWFKAVGTISVSKQLNRLMKNYSPEDLQEHLGSKIGNVDRYNENQKTVAGFGALLNADHEPPLSSIWSTNEMDQDQISPLAQSMLKVALANEDTSKMTTN